MLASGKRLRLVRKARGMKQKEIAKILGKTTRMIQNYEAGRDLNIHIINELEEKLDVNVDWLMNDRGFIFNSKECTNAFTLHLEEGIEDNVIIKVPLYEYIYKDNSAFHEIKRFLKIDNLLYKLDATQNIKVLQNIDSSLAPDIIDGDYIFFNDDTTLKSDEIYILKINGTLIPVKLEKNNGKIGIIKKSRHLKGVDFSENNIIGKVILINKINEL